MYMFVVPAEGAQQIRTQWDGAGRGQHQDLCGELSLIAVVFLFNPFWSVSFCDLLY